MKFRKITFFAFLAVLLSACNMSLAEDVTPPPGAVQPAQPQPTMGPLFPARAPDIQNGAAIYADNCAACHGESGLSDGIMTEQLTAQDITVPMLGAAEVAHKASLADWYQMVTLGNIEKFMPPFNSLSDQERWDVVAYAQSLSSASAQIDQGEELFSESCAECPTDFFANQEGMAALSTNDLVSLLAEGGADIPALGDLLSADELTALALYLRTLTVPASVAMPEPAPVTPDTGGSETPSAEDTSEDVVSEADAEAVSLGPVSGKIVSSGDVPTGVEVTLLGFEHAMDASSTPQEVVNQTVKTNANGEYLFEDVELSEGRIFLTESIYQGITFQSELAFTEAGMTELTFPDITVYENTTDSGGLVVEQLHISFDMAIENGVQVFELFTISNLSDKAYVFSTDGTSLPFMPLPEGATNVGLELSQDSAPLMPTEDGNFAMPPSEEFYTIIAFFNMPYDKELELSQQLALPVSSALVIVPEGIKVKADQLTDEGLQQTQGGANAQIYTASGLSAGSPFEMKLSGKVKSAGTSSLDNRQTLLIGAGAFGVVLILAGVWMFLRDRDKLDEDDYEGDEGYEEEEAEFESAEEVMDAIIALDDLHRAKKIPDEAYQLRREELKERLKELA